MRFLTQQISNPKIALLAFLFLAFYGLGLLYPDTWWGTHYLAFLPPVWKYLLLFASVSLMLVPLIKNNYRIIPEKIPVIRYNNLFILLTGGLIGLLFYAFPIVQDNYGDAFQYRSYLEERVESLPPELYGELFSYNLSPSTGRRTVLHFYTWLTYISGYTYGQVFKWVGWICGLAFVFSWLFFVKSYLKSNRWKIVMALIGLLAPFMQIYYGHIETYPFTFLFFFAWLLLLLIQLKTKKASLLWLLLPLLLLNVKLHPLQFLLAPAWLLACLHHYFHERPFIRKILSWKGILLGIVVPAFLAGGYLYFFVFEDYKDPRMLQGVRDVERLFLPIISPEAPLDRYNLWSFNHFFDFFNMMLLWSAPAFFLLLVLMVSYWKQIDWQRPEVIISGTTLFLFMALLFVINPMISMPMDWDLFSFPAPLLLLFVLVLLVQVESHDLLSKTLPFILSLCLLCLPVFMVNASVKPHSYRLESVGIRIFRTYYLWSARDIIYALGLIENDMDLYLSRKQQVLEKLKADAIPGKDPKYANLLMDNGYYYLRFAREPQKARDYLQQAYYYDPTLPDNLLYLVEACFELNDFEAAHRYAVGLVALNYPERQQALRIAIQCALEAGLFPEAREHCETYLKEFKDDATMQMVYERLVAGSDVEELKFIFRRAAS